MTNKHDFAGKSIKCDTWEQMEHLAKLAEEHGYTQGKGFSKNLFGNYGCYFTIVGGERYTVLAGMYDEVEITYSQFINPTLPTEVVEVTGCGDCPFYSMVSSGDFCGYPKQEIECDDIFSICPLKKASITIKLKQDDTTIIHTNMV